MKNKIYQTEKQFKNRKIVETVAKTIPQTHIMGGAWFSVITDERKIKR
jgi:hypothetical protein